MKQKISVAIDGPSGAGKSTVAKALAQQCGLVYVDTGAIYRTVGLAAQQADVGSKDTPAVIALLPGLEIDIAYDESGTQRMLLNGADVKVFLTASTQERARRRFLELQRRGSEATFDEVLRDIEYRDRQDSTRAAAPLKAAEDAVRIDTSDLSFEESVAAVAALIRETQGR